MSRDCAAWLRYCRAWVLLGAILLSGPLLLFRPAALAPLFQFQEPTLRRRLASWTAVPGEALTIFSAFYEGRPSEPNVLVSFLALSAAEAEGRTSACVLPNGTESAAEMLVHRYHDDEINFSFYKCRFPLWLEAAFSGGAPVALRVANSTSAPLRLLNRFVAQGKEPEMELAVCVMQAIHLGSDWLRLAAFLEHHIAEGASHFVLYRSSWSSDMDTMIRLYELQGLVTVIEYPGHYHPIEYSNGQTVVSVEKPYNASHVEGQFIVMHDCIYRMSSRARFVAILDVDEFLTRRNTKYSSVLQYIREHDTDHIGSFMFLHSFFVSKPIAPYTSLSFRSVLGNFSQHLNFAEGTGRSGTVWRPAERSKYIVKPETIDLVQVHNVLRFREPYRRFLVPAKDMLLINERSSREKVDGKFHRDAAFFAFLQNRTESRVRARLADL